VDGRLTLTVVTPERAVVAGAPCDEVTLPGLEGEMGILPAHTPLIALLGIGLVTFRDGAKKTSVAVRGGFAEIAGDAVRVLADEAAAKDGIDAGKAEKEKAAAEARRADVVGDEQLDAANADARFAEARISVAAS
jgi:F-type H+-transporting ATPase subunit epsilon